MWAKVALSRQGEEKSQLGESYSSSDGSFGFSRVALSFASTGYSASCRSMSVISPYIIRDSCPGFDSARLCCSNGSYARLYN